MAGCISVASWAKRGVAGSRSSGLAGRMTWFLIPSLVVALLWITVPEAPFSQFNLRRIADLTDIRNALETYRKDHGSYPATPNAAWLGLYNPWGAETRNWVPGVTPRYIATLPRDPRRNTDPFGQYLYRSDGADYKLISLYPGYDCLDVVTARPELADPPRGGRRCHAFGYWSPGAANW
jgi:hypothetical protein